MNHLHLAIQGYRTFTTDAEKVEYIKSVACKHFGLTIDELSAKCRKRHLVKARQILIHCLRAKTKLTMVQIGTMLGGLDHTTIMHSCNTVKNLAETDAEYRKELLIIENKVR